MKVTVDLSRALDIEHEISPLMRQAVTLPVLIDGKRSPIAIYIVSSAWDRDGLTDQIFAAIAAEIKFGLEVGGHGMMRILIILVALVAAACDNPCRDAPIEPSPVTNCHTSDGHTACVVCENGAPR